MKKLPILLLTIFCLASSAFSAEKYALIVAIGNYPDPGTNGWAKISSANDVPLIQNALLQQGFRLENITLLLDSMATKEGIKKSLDRLINRVHAGDVAVVHFSSHGEQIEDDNGDEVDGLDECIVPYGAVFSYDKAKFKEYAGGYLRDDEFGEKVTLLRNKLTGKGDLLVLLDACHSGTGTRGISDLLPRGAMDPMVSETFDAYKTNTAADNGVFHDTNGAKLSTDAATYVVISGAQAKEFNYECYDDNGNAVGSLSYAFSKSATQLKDQTSYRGLFAAIENIMKDKAPRQKPVLEGDGIDRHLFGGEFVSQKPFLTVRQWNTDSEFVLDGGSIAGLTEGSTISLYPSGTLNPASSRVLNRGTITKVSNYEATVQLEHNDTLSKTTTWAFVTDMNYGGKLKLAVRPLNKMDVTIKKLLSNFSLISFDKTADIFLDTTGTGSTWTLKYTTDAATFDSSLKLRLPADSAALKEALKRFARFRYLQGLDFSEEGLSAKVDLVFLKPDKTIDYAKLQKRTNNGRLELQAGDEVFLQIINTGDKSFYINIVDMQPDGKLNPILPYKSQGIRPEDCQIAKYDSLLLKSYKIIIGPPEGQETFKIFLSRDKMDLEDILIKNDDRASRSRGALNNMAKVFADANGEAISTRGGTGSVNTDQNGTIYNLNFTIKDKPK